MMFQVCSICILVRCHVDPLNSVLTPNCCYAAAAESAVHAELLCMEATVSVRTRAFVGGGGWHCLSWYFLSLSHLIVRSLASSRRQRHMQLAADVSAT
jgi:hypothetical protein